MYLLFDKYIFMYLILSLKVKIFAHIGIFDVHFLLYCRYWNYEAFADKLSCLLFRSQHGVRLY